MAGAAVRVMSRRCRGRRSHRGSRLADAVLVMTNVPAGMSMPPSSTSSSVSWRRAGEDDRGVPDKFLDGSWRRSGWSASSPSWSGSPDSTLDCGGELVAGGVGSGVEQDRNKVHQFVMGQPVAVVSARMVEFGDKVIGQEESPRGDQVFDVGPRGCSHARRMWCGVRPSATLAPKALLMSSDQWENSVPVFAGCASSADRHRVWASDVGDEVAHRPAALWAFDQLGDHVDACRAHP